MLRLLGLIAALFAATSVAAVPRNLDLKPTAGWQHAATGTIIMPILGGMTRQDIRDFGTQELDMVLTYTTQATGTTASIYLFRPLMHSVPIWFDRSRTAIEANRTTFPSGVRGGEPTSFPATGTTPPGLKSIYDTDGPEKSTGLVMVQVGDWLLAVRMTSSTLSSAALDQQITAVLRTIRFPSAAADPPVPVAPCAIALTFGPAKQLRERQQDSMMDALLGGALAASLQSGAKPDEPPQLLCRDGSSNTQFGVYHGVDNGTSYVIALADGGVSISVEPSLAGLLGVGSKAKRFSVTRNELDRSLVYAPFDNMPAPSVAVEMTAKARPISMTERGSGTTSITLSK